ncbi:ACP phosphodiesterase [Pseudomonas sp. 8209]|uniref:acyl carrier protein phosphodiesterase n=1 Tax=Pseudomonas sp. 8209 TaxID=2967214 RepID=UPI00236420CF|nr:ACP phosphodiesterase [Pseudomonas sp. 8209]MDD1955644.1 ACP phosphodiesterase [Pseudomonas sp. 8209]
MNYLAHLHLGGQDPDQLLGSLYGDFVKGPLTGQFSFQTEEAIKLHRKIDVFTDAHSVVRRALGRFPSQRRRYAGIVIDMFFDHCLARDWDQYSDVALDTFSHKVYKILEDEPVLPERLKPIAPLIISEDWLGAYRNISKIGEGLHVISQRLSQPTHLIGAYDEMMDNYDSLSVDFKEFYPLLWHYARSALSKKAV